MADEDDIDNYFVGDGCLQDIKLEQSKMGTLGATPEQVTAGMRFQNMVLKCLGVSWCSTRELIIQELSSISHSVPELVLHRKINFLESKRGDLTHVASGTTMECQTAVSAYDVSWEHTKRLGSQATWQCFGFKDGSCVVIETEKIREYLDRWNVKANESLRAGGRPYYSLSKQFLIGLGAVNLDTWITNWKAKVTE